MNKKIIIFGASLMGKAALDIINYLGGLEVFAFADNSNEKQKTLFFGYPVISAEDAVKSNFTILLASMYKYEIKDQLVKLGCEKYIFSISQFYGDLSPSQTSDLNQILNYLSYYKTSELLYDFIIEKEEYETAIKSFEKDKIVFCCDTIYQFFTAFLLRKTSFIHKKCVFLIGNRLNSLNTVVDKLDRQNFDPIVHFNYNYDLTKKQFDDIVSVFGCPEKFIYFEDSFPLVKRLLRVIPDETKSIYCDEGLSFYAMDTVQKTNKNFDSFRVDEFLGYNKHLFRYPKEVLPFTEISFSKEDLKQNVEELNKLFNYSYEPINNKIIYFDAPFHLYISEEKEREFLELLAQCLEGKDYIVKIHPSSLSNKFDNLNMTFISQQNFPWELYQINNLIQGNLSNQIYLSVFSNVSFFDFLFGKDFETNNNSIFLYNIFDSIIGGDMFNFDTDVNIVSSLIERIDSDKISVPSSIYELKQLI